MSGAESNASSAPTTHGDLETDDPRVAQLIERLPRRLRTATQWLRRPSSRWARIPAGVLLIFGGLLSILPVLGLWMLPLGLALLAEDAPPLRRARDRVLDWIERRWPNALAAKRAGPSSRERLSPAVKEHQS